jgi:beta-lactam-binding protein with PASTA domain
MENNNKSWLSFLITKTFFKHLSLSLAFVVLVVLSVLIILRFYTRHDDLIELPDFKGFDIEVVDSVLQEKSLRYIVIDSVFNIELPPLSVIDQDPISGSLVKENRRIYLTVVAKRKKQVQMPRLVDLSLRRAVSKLKALELSVGNLSFVPDMAKNAVLKQLINAKEVESGTLLPVGTSVDLVVGNGLSDVMVKLPNLKGLTKEDAEILLQMNSINVGLILYDSSVKDSSTAVVYRQRPSAEEIDLINLGRNVDIYLTNNTTDE